MAMFSVQQKANLKATKHWQRKVAEVIGKVAATAATYTIDLPKDHFIHQIIIACYEAATVPTVNPANLVDKIDSIQLIANGNKVIKDMTGAMCKQIMKINEYKPSTGIYILFFTDPKIDDAQPLPAWVFTSLQLKIADQAPASGTYRYMEIIAVESAYEGQDLSNWKVLVEKYLKWAKYVTNTGWQLYEHERAYKVYGYLYCMDDNGTLGNTVYDYIQLLGRKPEGEVTIADVSVTALRGENNAEIAVDTLDTGFAFLEWKDGFPSHEFASLYSKVYISSAGTNKGLRVLERYVL